MRDTEPRASRGASVLAVVLVCQVSVLVQPGCGPAGAGVRGSGTTPASGTVASSGAGSTSASPQSTASPVETSRAPRLLGAWNAAAVLPRERVERLVARNMAPGVSLPETLLTRHIESWRMLPVGTRIANWARLFAGRSDNVYCFGPKPGGYVADSLLVQDHKFDCVLLFYRCTELARAATPRDAILLAVGTRFAGAEPERAVSPTGAVDYDNPSHIDYSEEFAATGLWGRDVTQEVGEAVPETPGTQRYPSGSRRYIPKERIRLDRLRDGDLLFFVLDEHHPGARKLRESYGLLVGHQGIVHVEGGEVHLLHAAQSDLSGVYSGNRVVETPLLGYLSRMERFKGIMVSRIEDVPTDTGER